MARSGSLGYRRRMLRRRLQRFGYPMLGLLFLALHGVEIAGDETLSTVEAVGAGVVAVVVAVAVAFAGRAPLVLAAVTLASFLLRPVIPDGGEGSAYGIPAILAAYACALELSGRRLYAGALLCAGLALHGALGDGNDDDPAATLVFFVLLLGAPWAAGRVVRLARQRQSLLEDRARLLELQRDEQARAAVAEERQRIARELHDVVSHAISVVVLPVRGGRRSLEAEPAEARGAFDAIERTSMQALGEMRRLLGLLRADEGEAPYLPQPSLSRVGELADELRGAGLPVDVSVEGEPVGLPPGVDVSAYRIVQEALTNALKHAGPTSARVLVRYEDDAVVVEVVDDGGGASAAVAVTPGSGNGLVGIRERVALVGGEVQAGPRQTGGYAVRARLPYVSER
jgi:signal transduction histidine kinase